VRILVTGANGFVGSWLTAELEAAGHEIVPDPSPSRTDVTDPTAMDRWVAATQPDAAVHLAAVANPRAADDDPRQAVEVAILGTLNIVNSLAAHHRQTGASPVLLVSSSAEVYGIPGPDALPLSEAMPVRPRTLYALTKVAQEGVALGHGSRSGLRVVVVRSFNQIGPGQALAFAVPSFAARIHSARERNEAEVGVGNLDVRRDLTDVRDAVVAYRRLIEEAAATEAGMTPLVVNVGSGRSVAMRDVFERLVALSDADVRPRIDPSLLRAGEPDEIRADIKLLQRLTGWSPRIPLDTTLHDVAASVPAIAPAS
jgi:GDP-4-dehydro-6-deoxy-D-mannose reductase